MRQTTLLTGRLKLRFIDWQDLDEIHLLHSLSETDEYNTLGIPENIEVTKAVIGPWIAEHLKQGGVQYTFAIELIDPQRFVGLIALALKSKKFQSGEVWYKLNKDFWGKGYATEAVQSLLSFCFETLRLHRVEAGCAIANVGSAKVLEKSGMTLEGRKREVLPLKSGWSDNYSYSILESDYEKRNLL